MHREYACGFRLTAVVADVWYPEGYEGERLGTAVGGEFELCLEE
ncbi:MAG: hypothetical protein R6X34_25900 [Chloroflexota bacterium]